MNCKVKDCKAQQHFDGCVQHRVNVDSFREFTLEDLKYERHLMDAAEPQHRPSWPLSRV